MIRRTYHKYREPLLYLIFGGLTTLVNFAVYYPLNALNVRYEVSNAIAWVVAVTFAYVTNRVYVFESRAKGPKALSWEIFSFYGFRLLSLGIETGVLIAGVEWMGLSENFVKLPAQVIVIVLNYVFSKLWIFARPKTKRGDAKP